MGLLSSELLSNSSIFGASGSNIKSIQHGYVDGWATTSLDVTISSIDTSKSIIVLENQDTNNAGTQCVTGTITSATNLTFERYASNYARLSWTVIEYKEVKSKQVGTVTYSDNTDEHNVTINAVDLSKSVLIQSFKRNSTSTTMGRIVSIGWFVSSTQIALRNSGVASEPSDFAWQVIEFN